MALDKFLLERGNYFVYHQIFPPLYKDFDRRKRVSGNILKSDSKALLQNDIKWWIAVSRRATKKTIKSDSSSKLLRNKLKTSK